MTQSKKILMTLAGLGALALTQAACSPVSPSEAKGARDASDSTISQSNMLNQSVMNSLKSAATAVSTAFQKPASNLIANAPGPFITQDQYAILETATQETLANKNGGLYAVELPGNALASLKANDLSVESVDMDDMGLSPRLIDKKNTQPFAVLDNSLDSKTIQQLNEQYSIQFDDQKTSQDGLHGKLSVKFTRRESAPSDPVSDVDLDKTLRDSVRKLIFVLK